MLNVKNIRPLTEFRNKMREYIKELNEKKEPILLTQHGKSAAVLLDPDQFQEIQDEIEFMRKVARGLDDYRKDRVHSVEETFKGVDKIISSSKKR